MKSLIAGAVVGFDVLQGMSDVEPVLGIQVIEPEGVNGARLPFERRITWRTSGGDVAGFLRQWIPVVQVLPEIAAAFHVVNGRNDGPGHIYAQRNVIVALLITAYLGRDGFDEVNFLWSNLCALPSVSLSAQPKIRD